MNDKQSLVITVLARHIGRDNGIGVIELSRQTDLMPRQLRSLISYLREEGYAICGTPSHGYYIAANAAELEESCQFLRGRAMHSLKLESRLRKIPLPDLIGQLHLAT